MSVPSLSFEPGSGGHAMVVAVQTVNQDMLSTSENILARHCRPDYVVDTTFELFLDLGATDAQCDFPVVYASGANGVAGDSPETMAPDLEPLFDAIVREVGTRFSTHIDMKEGRCLL